MSTLAKRLLACKQPVIDLESEDIGEVITSSLIDASEVDNQVSGALNDIQMLGDTVDMLEACSSSASGLISQGVGPEIVTRIMEPTIINALASVDSEIALTESIEFESDDANADEGASWFNRIKDWVKKIWESVRSTIDKIIDWLSGMFNKVFDGTTRLNNRAKRLLTVIKAADDWEVSSIKGKAKWSIDFKDPTAQTLNAALYNQKDILAKVKSAATDDVRLGQEGANTVLKLFEGISRESMDGEFSDKLRSALEDIKEKRDANLSKTIELFNKGKGNDFAAIGLTAVADSNAHKTDIKFSSVKNSDDYTSGDVDVLDKANAIVALNHIIAITETMLSFKGEYDKAISNAKQMEKKIAGYVAVFAKSKGSDVAFGGGSIGSHIQNVYKLAFTHVSGDIKRLRITWSVLIKSPSLQSAANAYDFVETGFKKGRKTAEA